MENAQLVNKSHITDIKLRKLIPKGSQVYMQEGDTIDLSSLDNII